MRLWGEKPYRTLDYDMKRAFGTKVYRVALNGGFTCPNRDGTIGVGGCSFCSGKGSGDFAADRMLSITDQLSEGMKALSAKGAKSFIAYFQAFTNTYGPIEKQRRLFSEAIENPEVKILSVATRPDCLPPEVLELLSELNEVKPVWVELGLQTVREDVAEHVRRGYAYPVFEQAVKALKARGIAVIVHVILGLPGETMEDMIETVRAVNRTGCDGIKLQLLHVIRGTDLAKEYERGEFSLLSKEEYIHILIRCLEELSPEITVHRVTGDGPSADLIGPLWSCKKRDVLNSLHKEMKAGDHYQGKYYESNCR